jgi:chromosomal replication initiation ATPase DnaA
MGEQQIFNLSTEEYFFEEDFCISQSNQDVCNYLRKWPNWGDDNIINIFGPKKSGKTFLLTVFERKNYFFRISANTLNKETVSSALSKDRLIIEDVEENINEELLFLLFNEFKNNNKYLIFSSTQDSSRISFQLQDLSSRFKSMLNLEISNPSDTLLGSVLMKQLSEKQITIKKELITHTIKRIERSYDSVNKFAVMIDEESLKNKKKIDLKLINLVLSKI